MEPDVTANPLPACAEPLAAASPRPRRQARPAAVALAATLLAPLLAAQTNPPQDPTGINLQQLTGDRIAVSVNETTGVKMKDFVALAQRITNKVFVYQDSDIQNPANNINFVGAVEMARADYFNFFQTMLYIKGFACVIRGGDTEIVEIVGMAGARRNEIQSSAQYVPPEQIEDYKDQTGVTILTSVPLEYVNAQTATTALRPFFSAAAASGGGLIPGNVGNGRALLLQGFGPSVYAAYQLLRLVDIKPDAADITHRIIRLEHATAEELEPILKQIMDNRTRRTAPQAGAGVSGADLSGRGSNQLSIVALLSLNALVLSGTTELINEAYELVTALDVPLEDTEGDINVIPLKNVLADDLVQTLERFLQQDLAAQQQAQTQQAGAGARRPRRTVIVSHKESNSLLVSATRTQFRQLERMIDELDQLQPQVLIECALVELTTSDISRLGVELGLLDVAENASFTRPFGFTNFGLSTFQDTNGNGLPDTRLPDFENPPQGLTGGIISSDDFAIPVLINALATNEEANILSLPSVVVNNNEEAMVQSQEERPTQETQQGTATTSAGFQGFQGAGIELNISPSISSEDYLRLNITLTVSRFLTPFDPNSVTPGRKATRMISTQVTLPSGSTMVIGGVLEDSERSTDSGIPILKDIPLLGFLFRSSSREESKTNLYFFVTPMILDEDDFTDLSEISFRKKLEASAYIGHRRLQLVDRKWRARTLEDTGASIEDIDARGGFDTPARRRPTSAPDADLLQGQVPTGPELPTGKTTGNKP